MRRLKRMPVGVTSAVILLTIVLIAAMAPWIAPHDPYDSEIVNRLKPPVWEDGGTWTYVLGTDQIGRDTLTRLIYGAQVSLSAGFLAMLISVCIGVPMGIIAGFCGRLVDTVISTVINIQLTFPFVLLALTVVSVLGPSFGNVILVLGIASWTVYARVIRSEVLKIRELDYILASRALGVGTVRIVARHVFPNTVNTVIVLSTVQVARFIIAEAFLSFLGLGVQAPTPSWGSMLGDSRQFMYDKWWLPTFPGLAIFITTLAINLCGDSLRDWLDPYRRNVA
jgi:peptide/nickel transport system permease protein